MFFFGGGGNYSQMANFAFRTSCNMFWNIFDTSKKVTEYRPSGPLFITEILHEIKEIMETIYKHIVFGNLRIYKIHVFESLCPEIVELLTLWHF